MSVPKTVLQKEHVALTFGTPVSSYLWPDNDVLNAELAKIILQKEKAGPGGATRSKVEGWRSEHDLFRWDADCVQTLRERITTCALDMTRLVTASQHPRKVNLQMDCWANVLRRGQYNSVHDHPGATWSSVYYVSGGKRDNDDPFNGKLEFLDPRMGVNVFGREEGRYFVEPLPGLMVMFPGWLKHMVHPFLGSGERISISFNASLQFQQQTT